MAKDIIVIAHSSGAAVAGELLTEAPPEVLSKITYFGLDGTGSMSNALVAKMKAVFFVYGKDSVAGESANAFSMKTAHGEFPASHLFMVDADGSHCVKNASRCLHDTLITTWPHNPNDYNLHLDYQDFTGRQVVTSYVDDAVSAMILP